MKRKHFLRFLAFAFFSGALVMPSLGNAAIQKVKTISVQPLHVTLQSAKELPEHFFAGHVLAPEVPADVATVRFVMYDQDKAEVWRQHIVWEPEFIKKGKVEIPFSFDLREVALPKKVEVVATLYDHKGHVIASGQRTALFPDAGARPRLLNMKVEEEGADMNTSFSYIHEGEERAILPVVTMYEHDHIGEMIQSIAGEPKFFKSGQSGIFQFKVPKPEAPERYVVTAQIFDAEENPLTGLQTDYFVVDGDFAEIRAWTQAPHRFVEMGEAVRLSFSGLARQGAPLNMAIETESLWKGNVNHTYEETRITNVSTLNEFDEAFEFKLRGPASQFRVSAKLYRDGVLIEDKLFETEFYPGPTIVRTLLGQFGEKYFKVFLLFFGIIVFLILLKIHKSKESAWIALLFLGLLALTNQASAQTPPSTLLWEWQYPVHEWAYNPTSTEGFETMRFAGQIYDDFTWEPFFKGSNLKTAEVLFTDVDDPSVTLVYAVDKNNVSITNDKAYAFDLNLRTANIPNLDDGTWQVGLRLVKANDEGAESSWEVEPGVSGVVIIDATKPDVIFTYNGQPNESPQPSDDLYTKDPVSFLVTCDDSGGVGCMKGTYSEYTIQGNFCDDPLLCDDAGTRRFVVCDKVGNCLAKEVNLNFYVAYPPKLVNFEVVREDGGTPYSTADNSRLEAHDEFRLQLGIAADTSASVTLDTHACGDLQSGLSDFYEAGGVCREDEIACVVSPEIRGTVDQEAGGTCAGTCPDGYTEDPNNPGVCIRGCSDAQFPICFNWDLQPGPVDNCDEIFPLCFEWTLGPDTSGNEHYWDTGAWSDCSESCGGGTQTREVVCRQHQTNEIVPDTACGVDTKPALEQACNTEACEGSPAGLVEHVVLSENFTGDTKIEELYRFTVRAGEQNLSLDAMNISIALSGLRESWGGADFSLRKARLNGSVEPFPVASIDDDFNNDRGALTFDFDNQTVYANNSETYVLFVSGIRDTTHNNDDQRVMVDIGSVHTDPGPVIFPSEPFIR